MTRYEEMDERARRIVRGTMEPLSGWYVSPDDLEDLACYLRQEIEERAEAANG